MLKLIEIVSRYSWQELEPHYLKIYPKEKSHQEKAREAFEYIQSLQSVSTTMKIEIEYREDEDGGYQEVLGKDGTRREDGSEERFCIALVDWEKWLGMDIDRAVHTDYGDLGIVCHCLWEITWYGYAPETIQKVREDLNNQRLEDAKNIMLDDVWREVFEGN